MGSKKHGLVPRYLFGAGVWRDWKFVDSCLFVADLSERGSNEFTHDLCGLGVIAICSRVVQFSRADLVSCKYWMCL